MNIKGSGFVFLGVMSLAGVAGAQEESPEEATVVEPPADGSSAGQAEETAVAEPSADDSPAAETAPVDAGGGDAAPDGARFRFGVSGGVGPVLGEGFDFFYGGVDLRFGAQINDLLGIYAQPQLGFYSGALGVGGLVGASAVADFTFIDRIFVGAGVGYAVLNNPSGLELHMRVGGYPLMSRSTEKARRKGLMVGADLRLHFIENITVFAPTFSIGYEAF